MKILFVNALFSPFTGGVEKHTLELSKALARRGVQVHVLTGRLKGTRAEETIEGVKVHRVECTEVRVPALYPPPVIIAPKAYEALQKLDSRYDFDVIHLQDRWFPDFDTAALYAKVAGKPFVVTLHNARPLGIAPQYTVVGGLYDLAIGRQVLALADKIISVSKWAIGDVCKYGLSESKFVHIPNGIDSRKLKPTAGGAEKFRRKYGVGNALMVLYVGRVIKQKGLEYLLYAWKQVANDFSGAKLVVVGRGNELANLQKLSHQLGLQKSVVFTDYVAEEELYQALHACDVFVLPSLWEVLPIAILEAMAAGKPVVCTDAGGNPELVRPGGVNGLVVPKRNPHALAQALETLLASKKLRERMGRAGRKRAEKEFDWRIIARRTHAFYKKLLADFKRKRGGEKPGLRQLIQLSEEVRANLRGHRKQARAILREYTRAWKEKLEQAQAAVLEVI